METYVNESPFFSELENYLTQKGCELFLIQAEYKRPGTEDEWKDFVGLDVALEINSEGAPILFCSFTPEKYFMSDKDLSVKFSALIGKKRVGFIDTISQFEDFYNKYLELISSNKEEDFLAMELNRIKRYEEVMGKIKHVVHHHILDCNDSRSAEHIANAREIGVTGTDEEVFKTILDFEYKPQDPKLIGKFFPGVFCDLEGTLFVNGEVNAKLLERLKELSKTKPITLWTAGDIEEYRKKLISNGIVWKLVSKRDFFGAEVEFALDDLSYEIFQAEYGIKVGKFEQISTNFNEGIELKLKFLHSFLTPAGIFEMLIDPKFTPILDMSIGIKKIREIIKEMENMNDLQEYNQNLILLRDFLLSQ